MKKLLCLFLIAGFLSANGQQNDLIVKTTLDSILCEVHSIVGIGNLTGQIKYTIESNPTDIFSINKSEVFYIDFHDQLRPKYFNKNFDYPKSYFLKTGKTPSIKDPHLKHITFGDTHVEDWRYKTGNNLKTAGGLMLGSVVLSAVGSIVMSQTSSPEAGYILLGAGGVSLIAGFGFIVGAGRSITNN